MVIPCVSPQRRELWTEVLSEFNLPRPFNNVIWVTFARSNPSHDVHEVASFIEHKHWGCRGPSIIDTRI